MNWYSAQEYCWSKGAYLAEIQSKEEEDLLDQFLLSEVAYAIGLNDIAHEGRWVWSESHTDVEYTNWKQGEPSKGVGEDCGFKAVGAGAGWHDGDCFWDNLGHFDPVHALCETEASH